MSITKTKRVMKKARNLLTHPKAKSAAIAMALMLIWSAVTMTSCDKKCYDPKDPKCDNYVPPVIDDTIPDNPVDTTPDNPIEPKCDKEEADLAAAQAEEARINGDFTINADSCLYCYGVELPESFLNGAYGGLPNIASEPYTKKDSVKVLTTRTNNILPGVSETNPHYITLNNVYRTGVNALTAWDLYVGAQATTQAAQTALTDCQNSR